MWSVLVLFATREGQTEKVANRIAAHLETAGLEVRLVNAGEFGSERDVDPAGYDLLVFGASMHAGGLESELVDYVRRHTDVIASKVRSFFLVLLSAATRDSELREHSLADARRKMNEQLAVSFEDNEPIAGALVYSRYSPPLKWIMKRIARKAGGDTDSSMDYEYTDWQQVERYAERLVRMLEVSSGPA